MYHYYYFFADYLNLCIYRYDHYCSWVHNAIGGNNHRYFILYLFSIIVMSCHASLRCTTAFGYIIEFRKLWKVKWLDNNNVAHDMKWSVLIQVDFQAILLLQYYYNKNINRYSSWIILFFCF